MAYPKITLPIRQLEARYLSGESVNSLARSFGVSSYVVRTRLEEHGVRLRSLSESLRGRVFSSEWKAKISAGLRGRRLSAESRAKIGAANRGNIPWARGRSKASGDPMMANIGCAGRKHWNWKGGVSDAKNRFRMSSAYLQWRREIFIRDNWTCQDCNARSTSGKRVWLNAHHLISFALRPDLALELSNGITLCKMCHRRRHAAQPCNS